MRCLVVSRIVGNRWTQPPPTSTSRNHCKIQDLLVKVAVQMFDQQWEETAIFGNATSAFVSQLKWAEKKAKRRWCHQSTSAMWSEPSGLYHGCDVVEWLKKNEVESKISPYTHWTKHDMMLEDWEPFVEPHKNHHLCVTARFSRLQAACNPWCAPWMPENSCLDHKFWTTSGDESTRHLVASCGGCMGCFLHVFSIRVRFNYICGKFKHVVPNEM